MNRIVHFEIYTDDPKAVQPFYQDAFGWKFEKFEGGPIEYWLVTTGDDKQPGINGGMTRPREGQSPGTLNTIGVSSLDDSIKKLSNAAAKSARRRWQFLMSAGSLMPRIRPATSLESSSRIPTQNRKNHAASA
jgi:uncharacterized protein